MADAGPVLWDGDRYQMLGNGGTSCDLASSPRTLPWAVFDISPEGGSAPLTVTVDASRSTTTAQEILSYFWDFGDGSDPGHGVKVDHPYQKPGEFLLKLTVTDSAGAEGSVARKVSVSFAGCPVDPWISDDIGQVRGPGDACRNGDCLDILSAVGNISGTSDAFHFVHQAVHGDFTATCQVMEGWDSKTPKSIGLMARENTQADSREVSNILLTSELRLHHRDSLTASTSRSPAHAQAPWLKLERSEKLFTAWSSLDGSSWERVEETADVMALDLEVGFAAAEPARSYAVWHVCNLAVVPLAPPGVSFRRGDANSDKMVDISDPVFTISALFLGGDPPACEDAADSNDDGLVDISDAVYTLANLFTGGPAIPAPGPSTCGPDPTPGDLTCASEAACQG
jgi:PKD repeat protein